MRIFFGAALLCALIACGKDSGAPGKGAPGKGAPGKGKGAVDAAVTAPAPAPKPRAYFLFDGNKVAVGDADGYRRLGGDDDQFFGVVPLPDGTAWIGGSPGLARYDGATLVPVATPGLDKVRPVGAAPGGALWARTDDKLAHYDGAAWTAWTTAEAGATGPGRFGYLAVGADGVIYATVGTELLIGDGKRWRKVPGPAGLALSSVAIGGDGKVYVGATVMAGDDRSKGTVHELRGDAFAQVATARYASATLSTHVDGSVLIGVGDGRIKDGQVGKLPLSIVYAIGPDGTVWGRGDDNAVIAVGADGKKTRHPAKGKLESELRDVVVERGGARAWIVLENGLAVVEGGQLVLLPPGTIQGLPSRVTRIELAGDAVPLPPFPVAKRVKLQGRFVGPDGAPRKGVKVELCEGIRTVFYGKTPCAGQDRLWRATSGADGAFAIDDLPASGWSFNYSTGGKDWIIQLEYRWKNQGDTRVLDDIKLGK